MRKRERTERVAEQIRKRIADLLMREIKDPRIGFVSVMDVRVSPDLRYANAYVSLFGNDREKKSSLVGLQQSAGWLRREIGRSLRLRYTPEIRFFEDTSLDRVFRLEQVFREIHAEEEANPPAEKVDEEPDRREE